MTAVPQVAGRELLNSPSDGISNLRFSNHSDHLLVSSWDKSVRLYDASANVLRGEFMHGGPVLDCCFHDDSSGFSASADNTVRRLVFSLGKEDILGRHDAPVRCIEYSYATGTIQSNCIFMEDRVSESCVPCHNFHLHLENTFSGQVITGSWDKTLKCWDPRGASGQERTIVGTYAQPERIYSMSLVGNRLVVATAGRHVNVYDLRNMSQPEQRKESSLKYQTRCVRCYPNGTGYALSSVEGRIAMEFFDLSEAGQSKNYGTFATGGCDGYVNVWDGNNKKRLYQYSKYPTSIAALSFSRDGRLLAVASSYTYEEGDKPYGTFATGGCDGYVNVWDGNNKKRLYQYSKYPTSIAALSFSRDGRLHEPDAIFVRSVNEVEVKPKPKAYPNPTT
ncbi:hypothetical protein TEA_004370 [Camellia sinensis var. sinensis]|uniref:Uncharacterized protein n=1 Tax=Camellia sinensis var. sinensis TaxID=542762 RepID=A0A4S4CXC1_CAMSN|nr:hypothetical protein TEA_004370 [Camellia sinensis var. sinensis]